MSSTVAPSKKQQKQQATPVVATPAVPQDKEKKPSKKQTEKQQATPTSVVEQPVVQEEKKEKTKKVKATKAVDETPVSAPVEPVSSSVESEEVAQVDEVTSSKLLADCLVELVDCTSKFTQLKLKFKSLEKMLAKENKQRGRKKKRGSGNASGKQSGFKKPVRISRELATFLGETSDALVSRADVTSRISKYADEKGLKQEGNRKILRPDAALHALIGDTGGKDLTFFNLQSFLAKHFIKTEA